MLSYLKNCIFARTFEHNQSMRYIAKPHAGDYYHHQTSQFEAYFIIKSPTSESLVSEYNKYPTDTSTKLNVSASNEHTSVNTSRSLTLDLTVVFASGPLVLPLPRSA